MAVVAFSRERVPARRAGAVAVAAVAVLAGCDSPDHAEPPHARVSLVAPAALEVREADDGSVGIGVSFDPPPVGVLVALEIGGTATRDRDYALSTGLLKLGPDLYWVPAHTPSVDVQVDVYRDFDAEADETIVIALGEIRGAATAGEATRVEFTVVDGGGVEAQMPPEVIEPGPVVIPTHYRITPESVEFGALAVNFSLQGAPANELIVEWSSEPGFGADVNRLATVPIPPFVPGMQTFPEPHAFSLPLGGLVPGRSYFIRMYLRDAPESTFDVSFGGDFTFAFATNARGEVVTRCEAPVRSPAAAGKDPLFAHQWHLQNTGQTAFAARPGVAGADLTMSAAIAGGLDGAGVTLAVVDSGLEICHPDLAGNVEAGKSYNFGHEGVAGALQTDPFNHDIRGDHGTAVAGVAAAVAGNGLGGRGVAPGVRLRGFNPGAVALFGLGPDPEAIMYRSLGASRADPDSASVDVFNMSFGTVDASNVTPDFVRLMKMGTSELRAGRGALYVKAAGNAFDVCPPMHPLNRELGCIGSNADPDQNLPYLINVGAFNAEDVRSSYSSAGANLWVVAPAGEEGRESPGIVTTDQAGTGAGFGLVFGEDGLSDNPALNPHGDYTAGFGGTSAAAPATAGAIAILLGIEPELTWRDVKHILAASARRIDPDIGRVRAAFNGVPYVLRHPWQTNAAGYAYHNWYGFGAVAVDDAVALARAHAPGSLGEFVESEWFEGGDGLDLFIPDNDGAGASHALDVSGLPDGADIEAVVLEIRADHPDASDLAVELASPAGTLSILNTPFSRVLHRVPGLHGWRLMSNAFYGEGPNGTWSLRVLDLAPGNAGRVVSWRLRIYYGMHP